MVVVAQLVRAPDCGSGGRRFETDLPPKKTKPFGNEGLFLFLKTTPNLPKKNTFTATLLAVNRHWILSLCNSIITL